MSILIHLSKILFAILLIGSIPPNVCQLALASSSYISFPLARISSSQTGGLNIRDTRSRTLFTKYSELRPRLRQNSSAIESEIAAIFKGVAYGSTSTAMPLTQEQSTISTKAALSTFHSSTVPYALRGGTIEHKMFIGKQKEVYPNTPITSEKPNIVNRFVNPQLNSSESYEGLSNSSAYTYLYESEKYADNTKTIQGSTHGMLHHPSIEEVPESNRKEVQVRITSVARKQGFVVIQEEIGKAWIFHVYLTGITFGIVAAVCLLSLSRINTCSNLLPRGYFITLHLMIFLASFLRCLLFLHDPYGAYNRLPSVLMSLLLNTVDPCLTTAYAVVLMVLLRAAKYRLVPLNMQSPLVLATICGIHIGGSVIVDVSSGVLEDNKVIASLNISIQVATISWGTLLCLGYVASFSNIEKAAQRQQGDLARLTFNRTITECGSLKKKSNRPSLTYAARIFLICTLLHGLLIAFVILNLVTSKVAVTMTPSEAWAWWTQANLERIVEIVLCILLLATSMVLTQAKPRNSKQDKDEKIFSIFSNCGRGSKNMKNIDVYPVASEKCNILGNGTMSHSTMNSSMNYSTSGWKQFQHQSPDHSLKYPVTLNSIDTDFKKVCQEFPPMQALHGATLLRTQLNRDKGVVIGSCLMDHSPTSPVQTQFYPHLNNYSQTLPGNNYYCTNQEAHIQGQINCVSKSNTIRASQNQNMRQQHFTTCSPVHNAAYILPPSDCKSNNFDNDYEVAPYYTTTNNSPSSHTYSKPYSYYINPSSHNVIQETPISVIQKYNKPYKTYEMEPKSEMSICSSQSEIQVDYLTDASSSNDGLGGTLSRSLTLPLSSQNNQVIKNKVIDSTPDSAVGLDYSPQQSDLRSPVSPVYNVSHSNIILSNGSFEFVKHGHPSLNNAVKGSTALLGKIVNGGSNIVGYAPLSLDDTCTSCYSSDYNSNLGNKKATSISDLSSNDHPLPNRTSPNQVVVEPSQLSSPQQKNRLKHFQPSPVTCL